MPAANDRHYRIANGAMLGLLGLLSACSGDGFRPVTDAMLEQPDPDDWLMWRGTQASLGFSELADINRTNVADMTLAWSWELPDAPSQEGIPLVHDGILYFPAPLDLTLAFNAADGTLLWQFQRDLPEDVGSFIPFPQTNRNLAIYDNLIIDNGADDYIYAIQAETGELAWETQIFDYRVNPSKQGSAPLVADGKLISGRNCMPEGGPDTCVITAHDARTGAELWRRRTIPRPGEPGSESWGDVLDEDRWHVGAWMIPSYDPELGLVFIGTSVTAPAPKYMIGGNDLSYLYHNSTLALDVDTGELAWYYQHMVDHWDLDHAFERMLVDIEVSPDPAAVQWINPALRPGETRRVVTGIPGKTGLVFTLDRATGEFLWAKPTVYQNVVEDIITESGRVIVDRDRLFGAPGQQVFVCPTTNGGKNWPAGAYDTRTNIMYFPMSNTCMNATSIADEATPEMVYALNMESMITPGTEDVGTIRALSAITGQELWRHDQRAGMLGLLATAGDIVFGGDAAGMFRAFDSATGAVLWETQLGGTVTGHPVTFRADGRQFVAVSTGRSNLGGALGRYTPELAPERNAAQLYVFALPAVP